MRQVRNVYSTASQVRRPLSMEELRAAAPSIFAKHAFEGVSERYAFIPTYKIVEKMIKRGFVPVMAGQSMFRIEGKGEYAKHIIRFQREEDARKDIRSTPVELRHTVLVPEIALVNSHDRSSGYNLAAGLFRFACANGLLCSVEDAVISVRHSGDKIAAEVLDASKAIIEQAELAVKRAKELTGIPCPKQAQFMLAEKAAKVRWGTNEDGGLIALPFPVEKLLEPRRFIDAAPAHPGDTHPRYGLGTLPREDLFTTMNVIQENIMKGGIHGRTADGKRKTSTRAINSVSEDIRINKRIWGLAEEMAPILLKRRSA
jgi:hypothetical protein